MKIQYTSETPRKIRDYNEVDLKLGPNEVEDIAEIFNTPLSELTIGTIRFKTIE